MGGGGIEREEGGGVSQVSCMTSLPVQQPPPDD